MYSSDNNTLTIKPFTIPTDINSYLHFKSSHPWHLCSNILFQQFLRIKRNSTSLNDYLKHSRTMQQQFLNRGYPPGLVQSAAERAEHLERKNLFWEKDKKSSHRLHWTLDYTSHSHEIVQIVKRHWHLTSDVPGCDTFPEVGYKNHNL